MLYLACDLIPEGHAGHGRHLRRTPPSTTAALRWRKNTAADPVIRVLERSCELAPLQYELCEAVTGTFLVRLVIRRPGVAAEHWHSYPDDEVFLVKGRYERLLAGRMR